ncbi:MAG TPA: mucoidy inhibitor MuiA family protein [Opitutaceae bacterium]
MKTICLSVLFSILVAALNAAAVSVDSRISAVTVYQDRAVVTRTATVPLTEGTTDLVFANLPQSLNEQSLQVSGSGSAPATILDVSAKQTFVEHTPDARAKELEDQIKAIMKEVRGVEDRSLVLAARSTMIDKIENALFAPPAKDVPRPDLEQLTASLAYVTEQRIKIAADRTALDEERSVLKNRHDTLQSQLGALRGGGRKAVKTVTVRVAAAQPGALDVSLSYAVPDASWQPSYDARALSADREVRLDYFGIVRQRTGEDWNNVALTLSTARPSLGGAAPPMTPWQLDVYELRRPAPDAVILGPGSGGKLERRGYTGSIGSADEPTFGMADAFSPPPPPPLEAGFSSATVDTAATSAAFKIEVACTIPSDNSPQKVPVTSMSLAAQPEYLTAPKRQAAAFLTSKVENSSEFPLLAGAMNVFLDGTFVATSSLRTVMPGEKFDLALGVDEGISIKHRRVQKFTEDTGITGSGRRITYEYLLTIQNNKKSTEKVIVTDQVPLSRNEKIVVKVLAPEAREMKPTDEGALKWTLDLKPGEKRELTVKFTVAHPGDIVVAGLE